MPTALLIANRDKPEAARTAAAIRPVIARHAQVLDVDAGDLERHADLVFAATPPLRARMLLAVEVIHADGAPAARGLAINDAVLTAGAPHRMIDMVLSVDDDEQGVEITGDGVIVATPTGSTAYSASAGGPIVHPDVAGITITPICAQSLAFRPVVVSAAETISLAMRRVNDGTCVVLDGQLPLPLRAGDRVRVTQHERKALFVSNPSNRYWDALRAKMRWAAPPSYRA
jgi:NAD+ kinase